MRPFLASLPVLACALASANVSRAESSEDPLETRRAFWARATGGTGLHVDDGADPMAVAGMALGARLGRWTLGAELTYLDWQSGGIDGPSRHETAVQVGPEAALHFVLGRFEPFVGVDGGYERMRGHTGRGYVGVAGGADVYVSTEVSIGLALRLQGLWGLSNAGETASAAGAVARATFHFGP